MLRYRCLVLDHDDTTVDSTRAVNYPQFLEALARYRPQLSISEEAFFRYCYDPGFYAMCDQVLHYTPEELTGHVAMWKTYHQTHHPRFFPGIPALLARQRAAGGQNHRRSAQNIRRARRGCSCCFAENMVYYFG